MKFGRFFIGYALFFASRVLAQDEVCEPAPVKPLSHIQALDTAPAEPTRLFNMRLPFRTAQLPGKDQISVDFHSGNAWNPGVAVFYGTPGSDPTCPWPQYSSDPTQYKIYKADGVVRTGTLKYLRQIGNKLELNAALKMFGVAGGTNWADFLSSDRFIEGAHKGIFGMDDPFYRLKNKLNQVDFQFTGQTGKTLTLDDSKLYMGVAEVGATKFVDIIHNDKVLLTMIVSAAAGVPLHEFNPYVSGGGMVGTSSTVRVNPKSKVTAALAASGQSDQMIKARKDQYLFLDKNWRGGYRMMFAHQVDFKKGGAFSTAVSFQGITPTLSKDGKVIARMERIGIPNQFEHPEFWYAVENGGEGLNTGEQDSRDALKTGSEYLGLDFSYRPGTEGRSPTISVYVQEDWALFMASPGFGGSNNMQDWAAGVSVSMPVSCRPKR
ncbi:MAG: hypothetical protein JNL01_06385 [Bdellovibrionales bacterium]|nr:hypothetical protein [Bdellovibrionales bacterium]